jgi:hypothetical protein
MNLNANNIEKGMDVYGSDGEKIGSVSDVHSGGSGGDTPGGYAAGSSISDFSGMGNSGLVVEEVDVVEVVPDYAVRGGDMGTAAAAGTGATGGTGLGGTIGGSSDLGTSDTTWNAGAGSTGDIGAIGTANDQNTSPGYVSGGTTPATVYGGGYLHVEQGGILGIGAKDLYIPMSEVQDIDPGNCVSLSISKQQADDNYQTKPDFLDSESS